MPSLSQVPELCTFLSTARFASLFAMALTIFLDHKPPFPQNLTEEMTTLGTFQVLRYFLLCMFQFFAYNLDLQILSVAVSQATIDAYPKGGLLIELSIVVTKKVSDNPVATSAVPPTAGRDMSAGWAMIPWAELKAGNKTLTLTGGLPWAQQKIQPEDCGSKKGFFGISKAQSPVSSITLKLDAAGEAVHFPDKCVCPRNAVPLLQVLTRSAH
jgi:hypothetical protein